MIVNSQNDPNVSHARLVFRPLDQETRSEVGSELRSGHERGRLHIPKYLAPEQATQLGALAVSRSERSGVRCVSRWRNKKTPPFGGGTGLNPENLVLFSGFNLSFNLSYWGQFS